MDLSKLVIVALIGEALWETAKLFWQQGKFSTDRIGSVLIGVLLAVLTGLDLFQVIGIPINIPVVGEVLTGILVSRGANFMHDIIGSMNSVYTKSKTGNKN